MKHLLIIVTLLISSFISWEYIQKHDHLATIKSMTRQSDANAKLDISSSIDVVFDNNVSTQMFIDDDKIKNMQVGQSIELSVYDHQYLGKMSHEELLSWVCIVLTAIVMLIYVLVGLSKMGSSGSGSSSLGDIAFDIFD